MATWQDVRRIALALPEASEERSSSGTCSWAVKGKGFVWERPLRKSDLNALAANAPTGPILGVHTADLEMKEVLLKSYRRACFTTPHFNGYPAVLVCLDKISAKDLKDLIVEAWLARAPKRAVKQFLAKQT
ncbi:MAG TPA: MmcQ/YjbR family DNA-binding protein [Candidatus Baltobacteraceae bacterium]|nr:MmcQ/YjbR family DNA-binding protein [Candidatus Baltobacteraceae bacterium]